VVVLPSGVSAAPVGEPTAVRARIEEQQAMSKEFKEGAIWALYNGKRVNPYHPTKDQPMRSDWYQGFDEAARKLELLRRQYD
jgi:hypothetical protein